MERYVAHTTKENFESFDYSSILTREPLLEHVGHLPIIATYLHPYIQHTKTVNLGDALIMLAVHDIGETVVGDVVTYKKVSAHEDAERVAAKKLLPKHLFAYFVEFEKRQTDTAKFAKAVDALAPGLHELTLPIELIFGRFDYHGFTLDDIVAKKTKYFEWDKTLKAIFEYTMSVYWELAKQIGK